MGGTCYSACGILVPLRGIEPVLPAVEVRSFNHWTAREVPVLFLMRENECKIIIKNSNTEKYK